VVVVVVVVVSGGSTTLLILSSSSIPSPLPPPSTTLSNFLNFLFFIFLGPHYKEINMAGEDILSFKGPSFHLTLAPSAKEK